MAIHYSVTDHVAEIVIDRYERRNAIDVAHNEQLIDAWKRFRDDDGAWVAIITGVQDVFCSGGDLSDMADVADEVSSQGKSERYDSGEYVTLKGLPIDKPIIAAVNGHCIAGGLEIIGGTDLRVASENATFQLAEPRHGLIAWGGSTVRLPRQLSWPAAMEILLLASRFDAHRALELGLVNRVVPREQVLPVAREWAAEMTKSSPTALRATKAAAMKSFSIGSLEEAFEYEDEAANQVLASEDAAEGPRAFFEKRQPVWIGK